MVAIIIKRLRIMHLRKTGISHSHEASFNIILKHNLKCFFTFRRQLVIFYNCFVPSTGFFFLQSLTLGFRSLTVLIFLKCVLCHFSTLGNMAMCSIYNCIFFLTCKSFKEEKLFPSRWLLDYLKSQRSGGLLILSKPGF